MNREHVLSVLYDVALVMGAEVSVDGLLTRTVQRLLFHTSYPAGLVFLDLPGDQGRPRVSARLAAAVGDYGLTKLVGKTLEAPSELLRGPAKAAEDPGLLAALPATTGGPYRAYLRMPLGADGAVLLIAPERPVSVYPLERVFEPVMANLAKALVLCRNSDAYRASLLAERNMAQQSLADSEELLRSTFNQAAVGIARVGTDGTLLRVNRKFCTILGYGSPGELEGKTVADISMPDDVPRSLGAMRRLLAGDGETFAMEKRYLRKDGTAVWGNASISLARGVDGEPRFFIAVLEDIQGRKEAQERLERSEARLSEAQRVAQVGSWELDLKRDKLTWSHEVYRIFELNEGQFEANYAAFLAAVHPDDRENVNAAYRASVDGRTPYQVMHRLLLPGGRIKHVQERGVTHYDDAGRPLRSIGTVQDITQLHHVEAQLLQAQKMEAVGTLVGGIAHDFNNKLAAISGNVFLAADELRDFPHLTGRLKLIEQLCLDASMMIRQLLTFARKGEVKMAPVLLLPFLKHASALNRVAIPESIEYILDFGVELLPVLGDITQLQQVFLNLITNACDALEFAAHPRLEVSLRAVKPDARFFERHGELDPDASFALLTVRDNGCGIPAKDLPHIFEPFFTTKEVGKGTGLGLAMVYGVVERHHGVVEVDSSAGQGTTFSVYLPLAPELAGEAAARQLADVVRGQGETILLADDDPHVRETFRSVLESLGYQVLVARDGMETVEMVRRHRAAIDLVVLDMVMPRLKGTEAAGVIRHEQPDMPILYTTGYEPSAAAAFGPAGIEVAQKPFALDAVSRTIRRLLSESDAAKSARKNK